MLTSETRQNLQQNDKYNTIDSIQSNMKEEGSEEGLHGETKIDLSIYFPFCMWEMIQPRLLQN